MKLELEIADELWKRIEHGAKLFNVSREAYVLRLLENNAQNVPDPERAKADIAKLRAEAGPEDDYDIDEFLRAMDMNRGRLPVESESRRAVK